MPFDTPEVEIVKVEDMPALRLEEVGNGVTVTGRDFSLFFDKEKGFFKSFKYRGHELLKQGPRLNIWRAPIDNDVPRMVPKWLIFGLDRLEHKVEMVDVRQVSSQLVQIRVAFSAHASGVAEGLEYKLTYTIYGTGDILIDADVVPNSSLPPLPRVGLQFTIPKEYNIFIWYGRGPHENYCDRNEGAPVGLYSGRPICALY